MAIDYTDIGKRISAKRKQLKISQEKLAELVGIGPSHMSHIENGTTVPSFEVFITLCNVLESSADELLCREIVASKPIMSNWLTTLIEDCDATETKILTDVLTCTNHTLRKNKVSE